MATRFINRLKHAWNAFNNREPTDNFSPITGMSYSVKPDRPYVHRATVQTIAGPVYNRISIDVAAIRIEHARTDQNGNYLEMINSKLNNCLTLEANKDQGCRSFVQDIVLSMFDEGAVAIVPVDTDIDPTLTTSYEILSLRTAKITDWYPDYVRVDIYDDRSGAFKQIVLPKKNVAIVENPLYLVMNEYNSTLKRLTRKLALLDKIDEASGSDRMNIVINLPYTVKGEISRRRAEQRIADIELQLRSSPYGIVYLDATEKVTQLNRAVETTLNDQVKYLTEQFYNQLGMTEAVFNGTASPQEMLNYYSRSVEPIIFAICNALDRAFITKTARSQGQSIKYFNNPFRLVPTEQLAEIADKFTRNEILSSNEFRSIIGYKPVNNERANELRNKNLNADPNVDYPSVTQEESTNNNQ